MRWPWQPKIIYEVCDHADIASYFECIVTVDGERVPFGRGTRIHRSGDLLEVWFTRDFVTGTMTKAEIFSPLGYLSECRIVPSAKAVGGSTTIIQRIGLENRPCR